METILTCPLGSECETIKDNKLYRCRWFKRIQGKHPQSNEILDQDDCAIAWFPILQIENSQMTRGVNSAITSLRDETTARQDRAISEITLKRIDLNA